MQHSTALATPPPPAPLPSPHYFYLCSVLSDSARAQMQVILRFCFFHSASKLGKRQYLATHFVAKDMGTSRNDPEHTAQGRGGRKPPRCDIFTWPLQSPLPPVQEPSHTVPVWKHLAAGSVSWVHAWRALLICQPSHQVLH